MAISSYAKKKQADYFKRMRERKVAFLEQQLSIFQQDLDRFRQQLEEVKHCDEKIVELS